MQHQNGYSADVRMTLRLNGHTIPIAQMGPDFLILDEPVDHPPCVADVVLSVDGNEQRWKVRLPEGIQRDRKRIQWSKALSAPLAIRPISPISPIRHRR